MDGTSKKTKQKKRGSRDRNEIQQYLVPGIDFSLDVVVEKRCNTY